MEKVKTIQMNIPEFGQHPKLVYLTAIISIVNITIGQLTKSDVAWVIGIMVGIFSLVSAVLTWREKILSIRKLKKELGEDHRTLRKKFKNQNK